MRSITLKIYIIVLAVLLIFCSEASAGFFPWSEKALLSVNEVEYSTEDFKNWWGNWREKDMVVPETPDAYIDWLLFVNEAERMLLYDDAQLRHNVMVYLKVLSLLQLKNDEVDSKIIINDDNLWEYYKKTFTPEWTLNTVIYLDEESAQQAYQDLQSGNQMVKDLVTRVGERSKQAQAQSSHGKNVIDVVALKDLSASEEKLLGVQERLKKRPLNLNTDWQEALSSLPVGSFSQPIPWQDSFVILNPVDISEGSREDFEKRKNSVKLAYRKNQAAILTTDLVTRLMEKYNVVIDEERIKMIDYDSDAPSTSDEPLVTMGEITVSEQQIIDKVKEQIAMNRQYGFKTEETERLAQRVVNGIVTQTLITMESLDRHYELQSPIRELVDFKKMNNLVKKIDKQISDQVTGVDKDEAGSYYKKNIADYTKPALFHMAVISDAEEELKKIWLEVVVNGKDVMTVTESRLGYRPQIQKYPANHLKPEVKKIAEKLAKGDLSQIFYANGKYNMVYMIDYIPGQTVPFNRVKEEVRQKIIKEKISNARREYLDKLRVNAAININENAWTKLRRDLVSEDAQ